MKKYFLLVAIISSLTTFGQNSINPPVPGEIFPEFSLPVFQGGNFTLSQMRGKNILLISSRGKYADDHWCAICNYQYADFSQLVLKDSVREKLNLEIVFIMPYSKDVLVDWEKSFPEDMKKIEGWKHPQNPENLTTEQQNWTNYTLRKFPKTFTYPDEKLNMPIPVLMDEKQELSKGLDIFRTEWNGAKTAQNIPAVYIIDSKGVLRFKYISQNTFDRPTSEYLIEFIEKMLN